MSTNNDELVAPIASAAAVTELPRLDGMKVLLVDDDPDSLKLVGVALGQCGATILQAMSVAAAMLHLEQSTPDVIISDVAMPTQDGIDLVRQVRARKDLTSKVPMVALTAYTSDDDRRRILAGGFNDYLAKPVAPLELMRVLAALRNSGASPTATV